MKPAHRGTRNPARNRFANLGNFGSNGYGRGAVETGGAQKSVGMEIAPQKERNSGSALRGPLMQDILRQLQTIGDLQRHLLPRHLPHLPGWGLAVHHAVGAWPGGNYYDFLPLADSRLVFLLADASDSGGPAAALVAMVRVLMHSCPLNSGQERLPFCPMHGEVVQVPHIILGNLNRVLVENSLEEQYMSAFCGVLSPREGLLHFANAGHPSPRWWHARTRTVEALRYAVGLPLGIDLQATYHHKRITVEPGDVLLFYTNGITAAQNPHGLAFGAERLDAVLHELAGLGAEAVKNGLLARLENFHEEKTFPDDLTVLVFKRQE